MKRVLVLNGPNLNLLGTREPEIYGSTTLPEIEERLVRRGAELGLEVKTYQSNHEGALIDRIHERDFDWIVINAGGLTHTSVSLRDALVGVARPFVEVHLSDPDKREEFRRVNFLHDVAAAQFAGHGAASYTLALEFIAHRLGLTHAAGSGSGADAGGGRNDEAGRDG